MSYANRDKLVSSFAILMPLIVLTRQAIEYLKWTQCDERTKFYLLINLNLNSVSQAQRAATLKSITADLERPRKQVFHSLSYLNCVTVNENNVFISLVNGIRLIRWATGDIFLKGPRRNTPIIILILQLQQETIPLILRVKWIETLLMALNLLNYVFTQLPGFIFPQLLILGFEYHLILVN